MSIRKKQELEQVISDVHLNNLNYHSREIYLHSFFHCDENIGETGVDYRMSIDFVKNLHILSSQAVLPIVVHMHSIGGSWNDGMAIFDAIRFSGCPITIVGYSQASSMTGIIIQSADKRILSPNCEFMIHHGSLSISSSTSAVEAFVEMNKRYSQRMLQIFSRRAIKTSKYFKDKKFTEEKVYNFISRKLNEKTDWYMDAEEAVFYGFADGIFGTKGLETADHLKCENKFKGLL
jgi:ATP-dependent protease ClpP protease subunit